jgi:tetratricopeptide (TPR) repeat protein
LILAWLVKGLAGDAAKKRPAWRPAAVGAGGVALAVLLGVGTREYLKEWQSSEQHWVHMLRLAPQSPYVHAGYGRHLLDQGKNEQAILCFTRAIELYPDFAQACYDRGIVYCEKGDLNQGIRDYTRAIEVKPDYAQAYYSRGLAYCEKSDYTQALRDYTKAIEVKPDYAEAYNNRGGTRYGKGDYEQSVRDCARAIELNPRFAEAYRNRAMSYYWLKEYDKAWADVMMCRQLGGMCEPDFVRELLRALGRK